MGEIKLMKGNEALAEAMIRSGCDAYFGYPITPQSEVLEYLTAEQPQKRTGMVVLQAESEVAAINMVHGAAGTGKRVMTTSSSPGISLMQETISYMSSAEIPCVIANVVRGGPGLGTIQPSQADYFQATKGGGHGDYNLIVLAPATVQEMVDFVKKGFELSEKYRMPVMLLADGAIGQMMEKIELFEQIPRKTDAQLPDEWATKGRGKRKTRNFITSLNIQPEKMEIVNQKLQAKYREIEAKEVKYEAHHIEDAEYIFTGFGLGARISNKAAQIAREKGYKVGVVRPITVWPFPYQVYKDLAATGRIKGILDVEMNAGQMIEDVKLAVGDKTRVEHYGRMGGVIASPDEIVNHFEKIFIK
jgi:2-oxoglutarate ferredoxin oxidoreductase subunit alpha